jgi:hypothetical protein
VDSIRTDQNISLDDLAILKSHCCFVCVDVDDLACGVEYSRLALAGTCSCGFQSFVEMGTVHEQPSLVISNKLGTGNVSRILTCLHMSACSFTAVTWTGSPDGVYSRN